MRLLRRRDRRNDPYEREGREYEGRYDGRKRRRPWIVRFVGGALRGVLMALGAVMLTLILSTAILLSRVPGKTAPAPLPPSFVLTLSLGNGAVEHANLSGRYSFSGGGAPVFPDIVDRIHAAARDGRVKGLLVTVDGGGLNLAQTQEFREAVAAFRKSGRPAHIYASSYGDMGLGLGAYYLASAFDEIWMQPLGTVSIAGIRAEVPFARDLLDKIGVKPEFFARKEYKTLFESATGREMSEESRAMLKALIDDLGDQIVTGIAADKGMGAPDIARLVERGFFTDEEAVAAGLVDHLDDIDHVAQAVAALVPGGAHPDKVLVPYERYAPPAAAKKARPRAALIYVIGMISSADVMMASPESVPAEDIARYIRDAAEDGSIGVIVLRIDSPGGSPAASESIRRAVLEAQAAGKKVIVSMGETAASGGYWVASPADRIFAAPGTITGSIGVAGGKPSIQELWRKVGVNWEYVQYGGNAGLFSLNEPFGPQGEAVMNRLMDTTYDAFITRVAQGRKMSPAQVEKVARGRVWSGRQAQKAGLVDELGGLGTALDYAARQMGVDGRAGLDVVVVPQPLTQLEMLFKLLESQAGMIAVSEALGGLAPLARAYQATGLTPALLEAAPVTMETLRVRP